MNAPRDDRFELFESAFEDGHRHAEAEVVFRRHSGRHKVRTRGGQLEVGGCLFPAARGLPPGEYPVECAQGVPASGAPRNAFGRMVFAAAPPVRWERLEGQVRVTSKAVDSDAITEEWVKTDELRVEVGNVAFAEPGFGERLEQLGHEYGADDFDELLQLATAGLVELAVLESTAVLQTSQLEGKRSVAMRSGRGDGTYAVYGGYAADGTLTRLLVDFDVLSTSRG